MKKLFFLFMMMLPLACTEEGIPSDGGSDDGGNEMAECVCPASVRAGKDAVLQWEGFVEGDVLKAVSESGDVYDLIVTYVTSSGMGFTVPVDVPAGRYMLVLDRSQRVELGEMEITAPSMPITGLSVQAKSLAGETVLISGVGYVQGCKILFAGDEEYELAAILTNEGVTVVLPEDMPVGTYQVYLLQDNLKWPLKENFSIIEEVVEAVEKELVELRYYVPYIGEDLLMLSWKIEREDILTLTHSENIVSGGQIGVNAQDIYVSTGTHSFELSYDGYEYSDNYEFTYNYVDGVLANADVVRYNGETVQYEWKYDEAGYMTEVVLSKLSKLSIYNITYESGNIAEFEQIAYEYGDPTLVNAPCAPDVAWAYKAINEWAKPAACFPYLLGWYDKASVQLPTMMYLPDTNNPDGAGKIACQPTYEFDAEGYVSKMSWTEGSEQHSIEFIYR